MIGFRFFLYRSGRTWAERHTHREPLTLPLTDFVYSLLKDRKANADSEYVFAGSGKTGYLIEPRHQVQKQAAPA